MSSRAKEAFEKALAEFQSAYAELSELGVDKQYELLNCLSKIMTSPSAPRTHSVDGRLYIVSIDNSNRRRHLDKKFRKWVLKCGPTEPVPWCAKVWPTKNKLLRSADPVPQRPTKRWTEQVDRLVTALYDISSTECAHIRARTYPYTSLQFENRDDFMRECGFETY